jgi:hypothetical protein
MKIIFFILKNYLRNVLNNIHVALNKLFPLMESNIQKDYYFNHSKQALNLDHTNIY